MAPDTGSPPADPSPRPRYRLNPAAGLTERRGNRAGPPEAMFRNKNNGQLFRLGPEEYFLLREISSGTPFARITAAFRAEFGKIVRPRAIGAFAAQMVDMGALEIDEEAGTLDVGTPSAEDAPAADEGDDPAGPAASGPEPAPAAGASDERRSGAQGFGRRRDGARDHGLEGSLEDLVFGPEGTGDPAPGDAAAPSADDGDPDAAPSSSANPEIAGRDVKLGKRGRKKLAPGMIRLFDPKWLLRLLNGLFGWTGPVVPVALVPLTLIAALVMFHRLPEVALELQEGRTSLSLIGVVILSAFTVNLFRVLCLGVTTHRWGGAPGFLGLVFVLFVIPRFTIDQSVVRQLPREGQLAVHAAGLKSRLFLFGLGTTVWAVSRHNATMLPELFLIVGQIGLLSFLLGALPVLNQDGYRYLTTYFNLPMLKERAFHHVFGYPRRGPGGISFPEAGPGERWVYYFYVVGAVLFLGLVGTLFVFYVSTALEARFGGTGVLMFFGLTALILLWLTAMRRFRIDRTNEAVRSAVASRRAGGGGMGMGLGGEGPGGMGGGGLQPGAGFGPGAGPGGAAPMSSRGGALMQLQTQPDVPWASGRALGFPRPQAAPRPLPGLYGGNETRARRARWRTRLLLVAAAAGLLYVAFLPYDYEVGGEFTILPASRVQVNAGVAGELVEILVDEGDIVEAGQVLARLSDLQPRHQLAVREAELAQAQAALQKLLDGAKPEEIAVARAEVEKAEALLPYYQGQAERARTLLERGVISDVEAELQMTRYVEELQSLETARANLARVEADASAAEIAMAEAQVAGLEAQVAYNEALLERIELRAPTGGRVVTENLRLQLGKALDVGDLFAEIENHEVAPAEVRVSEADIGLVQVGDRVRLRAWALADVEWTGQVRSLSPVAEDENFGRVVRVRTDIPNEGGFFRPQMTGYAKIDGEEMQTWQAFTRLFDRFFRIEVWGWIP